MDIIVYELVQVWRKSFITLETKDKDKIKDEWENGDYYDSDYLYETEELVDPKINGDATLEIYDSTGTELIYSNKDEVN